MSLLLQLVHQSIRAFHRSTLCFPAPSIIGRCASGVETLKVGTKRSPITKDLRYLTFNRTSASSSYFEVCFKKSCRQSMLYERSTESQTLKKVQYDNIQTFKQRLKRKLFIASWSLFDNYDMRTAEHCTAVRYYVTNSTKAPFQDTDKLSSCSANSCGDEDKTETSQFPNTADDMICLDLNALQFFVVLLLAFLDFLNCSYTGSSLLFRILTVPNALTFVRMVLAPVLGYLVLTGSYATGCGVFMVASITDLLDGFIARHFPNQTSALGSFIDPLADKFLVSTLFISLTVVNLIPVALTSLVIARDICLMSGGFYVRYISLNPRPKSLKQYFDLTNASAHLRPTTISKLNTGVQLSLVAFTLCSPVFDYVDHPALHALWYVTAASTIISGFSYVFAKDTFKILQQKKSILQQKKS